MADSKELQQSIRDLAAAARLMEQSSRKVDKDLAAVLFEVKTAAKLMGQASEKLSSTGLDKLTEELAKSIKQRKLLSDLEADAITDSKKMAAALAVLEKRYEAVTKIEEEIAKEREKTLSTNKVITKGQVENQKKLDQGFKETLAARLKEIGVTEEYAELLKNQLPLLRAETEARTKSIASVDGLNKIHDSLRKTIVDQVNSFGTWQNAMSHLTKAVTLTYDQMNRLSGQGMIGAFETLQWQSIRLMLSAKDLEEVMSKNRDLVNQMGGGIDGVKKFADVIYEAKDQLSYLGKDWAKAAVDFVELSKHSGLTPKDGNAYKKNFNQSIESFKNFSAMFGDTPEQFKALQEGMLVDENIRQRLNNLNKTQLAQELEEIRQRTYNLKVLGLSNDQIVSFNSKLAAAIDPSKPGMIGEHQKNAVMLAQYTSELINKLSHGTPEQQELSEKLRKTSQSGMAPIQEAMRNGNDPAQFAEASQKNVEYLRDLAKAKAEVQQHMKPGTGEVSRIIEQQLGEFGNPLLTFGGAAATSQAQGGDLKSQYTPDQLDRLQQTNRENLLAENGPEATALKAMAASFERIQKFLDGPFGQALIGATAGLVALALASGAQGLLGVFRSLIASGAGTAATMSSFSKLANLLGKAGVGLSLLLHTENAGMTDKEEKAELEKRRAKGFVPYNGINTPGAISAPSTGGATGSWSATPSTGDATGSWSNKEGGSATGASTPNVISTPKRIPGDRSLPPEGGSQDSQNSIAKIVQTGAGFLVVQRPDGQIEKIKGSRNWRNNNPGNLEYNSFTQSLGAIGSDGRFAIFPTYDIGKNATAKMLFQGKNYKNLSLSDAIARYAPQSENNTKGYQSAVLGSVGGVNKAMSDYTSDEQQKILSAMQTQEGFKPGTVTAMNVPGSTGAGPQLNQQLALNSTSAPISTAVAATTVTSTVQDPTMTELQKHTALLASIAQNTTLHSSIPINEAGYKQDTALVTSGIAG